jgi:hypothetical protein
MSGSTACGALLTGICLLLSGCGEALTSVGPSVVFTKLPPAGEGSPERLDSIEGRVTGAQPGQRIVLFAKSGLWWEQPLAGQPFTPIRADSTWKNVTHPGSAYAALLVDSSFRPPPTVDALPEKGGAVLAVAIASGPQLARPLIKTLQFSGYEWQIRQTASDHGGTRNLYDPANAWTDSRGFLHLRIAGQPNHWTSAEVDLIRSLGYGTYRFTVRDVSHLEPAVVFSMLTWDENSPPREMDIEISRWGEVTSKNAQYVIQPYYVPANTFRFMVPAGLVTYTLRWEPGRALFRTGRGHTPNENSTTIAEHVFTSGVTLPGSEEIHMNLYVFDNKRNPQQHETEVIVEKFEYLP